MVTLPKIVKNSILFKVGLIYFVFCWGALTSELAYASDGPAKTQFSLNLGDGNMENMVKLMAQRLLAWNQEKLRWSSNLKKADISELFASDFVVKVNGRIYQTNHDTYLLFLNKFRNTIETIDYDVQEFIISSPDTVTIPLMATVVRRDGVVDIFDAIMLLKYDEQHKIKHWQEVYALRSEGAK